MKMVIGFAVWAKEDPFKIKGKVLNRYIGKLQKYFSVPCPLCNMGQLNFGSNMKEILNLSKVKCSECRKIINIEKILEDSARRSV
jgi:hypothetical protein